MQQHFITPMNMWAKKKNYKFWASWQVSIPMFSLILLLSLLVHFTPSPSTFTIQSNLDNLTKVAPSNNSLNILGNEQVM